jgi:pimeloyl-ACP methyl ester carboxylesterase
MKVLRRLLAALLLILVALVGAGAIYEAVASAEDGTRYPPPGRLVDVGGYRVHVLCMGEGSPTVLLDAWSGGWTSEWELVQPRLAQTTRVCAWDRAGSGWSDPGLHSNTPEAYMLEMDAMLRATYVDGPYVLVAASYAGRVARLYASQHPEQVVGLVFVDAVHEDAYSAQDIADQRRDAPVLAAGNWVLSRLGMARLLGAELPPFIDGPVAYNLPESTRQLIAIVSTRPKNLEGNARLAEAQQASDAQLRAAGGLGNRPVVVISSTDVLARLQLWREAQLKLANLSSRSTWVIVESNHLIAWNHPSLVVDATQCVLAAAADATQMPIDNGIYEPCRSAQEFATARG